MIAVAAAFGLRCTPIAVESACILDREIWYPESDPPHRQVRAIWHELIEHLARQAEPALFDTDPTWSLAQQSGYINPADMRHRIAIVSESILIEAYPDLDPIGAGLAFRWRLVEESEAWHAARTSAVELEAVRDPEGWGNEDISTYP
jgi:hypothetical protein